MDEQLFWKIVEDTHAAAPSMHLKCEALTARLASLTSSEAVAFQAIFDRALVRAYDYSVWGAAYVINGGCGDDTFLDFRSALISRGQRDYLVALSEPDSLAPSASDLEDWFYEGYQYAVSNGVRAHFRPSASPGSGGWLARFRTSLAAAPPPLAPGYAPHPREPSGRRWNDDELPALYPKLWARAQAFER